MNKKMKPSNNQIIKKMIRRSLQTFPIEDGDVLVVKVPEGEDRAQFMKLFNGLRESLSRTGRINCVCIMVSELIEITNLSEKEMNSLGWYKQEIEDGEDNDRSGSEELELVENAGDSQGSA